MEQTKLRFFLFNSPNLITQILIMIFTCLSSRARGLLETIKRLLIKTPSYILNYKISDDSASSEVQYDKVFTYSATVNKML
jgi:hypothetical protein